MAIKRKIICFFFFVSSLSSQEKYIILNQQKQILLQKNSSTAFQPGSLYKIFAASYLLQKIPYFDPQETIYCPGWQGTKKLCWIKTGHKAVNLQLAISKSCNYYFYFFAKKINLQAYFMYLQANGLPYEANIRSYQQFIGSYLENPPTLKQFATATITFLQKQKKNNIILQGLKGTFFVGTLQTFRKKFRKLKKYHSWNLVYGKTGTSDDKTGNVFLVLNNPLTKQTRFVLYSNKGKMAKQIAETYLIRFFLQKQTWLVFSYE